MDFCAFEHVPLCSWRDFNDSKRLALVKSCTRFRVRVSTDGDFHCITCIQCLHDPATQLAEIVVDYCNRNLSQDLIQIRLRVIDAVYQRSDYQKYEGPRDRKHAAPFGRECASQSLPQH